MWVDSLVFFENRLVDGLTSFTMGYSICTLSIVVDRICISLCSLITTV